MIGGVELVPGTGQYFVDCNKVLYIYSIIWKVFLILFSANCWSHVKNWDYSSRSFKLHYDFWHMTVKLVDLFENPLENRRKKLYFYEVCFVHSSMILKTPVYSLCFAEFKLLGEILVLLKNILQVCQYLALHLSLYDSLRFPVCPTLTSPLVARFSPWLVLTMFFR